MSTKYRSECVNCHRTRYVDEATGLCKDCQEAVTTLAEEGTEIKRIDIKEFREFGFLQELNRQFLHPLGLALEIAVDDETGEETLGGIWDYRDDPEGMGFGEEYLGKRETFDKKEQVQALRESKASARIKEFGGVVQPLPYKIDHEKLKAEEV